MALGVDNQAAILATLAFQSRPGHHLADTFDNNLRKLLPHNDGRKLVIRLSPGHEGMTGNEAADEEAKKAAAGDSSAINELPKFLLTKNGTIRTLPQSKATHLDNNSMPRSKTKPPVSCASHPATRGSKP